MMSTYSWMYTLSFTVQAPRRYLGAGRPGSLPDRPGPAQLVDRVAVEAEQFPEDVVGVLAEQRQRPVGPLDHLRHLDRVAGDERGLVDAVGPRDLDDHPAQLDVLVVGDLRAGVARPGRNTGLREGAGGVEVRQVLRPVLERGPDDRLVGVRPPAVGKLVLPGPLGMAEQGGQPLELVRAGDLQHDKTVTGTERAGDPRG